MPAALPLHKINGAYKPAIVFRLNLLTNGFDRLGKVQGALQKGEGLSRIFTLLKLDNPCDCTSSHAHLKTRANK